MTFYLLKPCQGKAAFEAILRAQVKIDLSERVDSLRIHGYNVMDAGVMIVAKKGDISVSIYPSAKLLIKCKSEEEAARKANEIYEILDISHLL
jgi:ArsR family metal-binding transcriptional regulator